MCLTGAVGMSACIDVGHRLALRLHSIGILWGTVLYPGFLLHLGDR